MQLVPAREIDYRSLKLLLERSTGGSALKKQREIDRITKAYRRGALVIPPNETEQQRWWRCEARFMLGDFSDWTGFEYRDEWAATLWHNKPFPIPPWNALKTKKLYIIGEQGIGDEICYSSCIPDCLSLADEIVFECEPRLRSIFERSFGIRTIPAKIEGKRRIKQDLEEGTSAWMGLADLPRIWRLHVSHFPGTPYIKADPAQIERFSAYKGRVGLSWRGAQGQEKELLELHPDAISLQYDLAWDEEIEVPRGLDLRNDLEGVLGLLSNLKKIVTVSTSVAHFSCALGRQTDVIIADPTSGVRGTILPWRWYGIPNGTPWYRSAKRYDNIRAYKASL